MSALARRGRFLLLIITVVIVVERLADVAIVVMMRPWEQVTWRSLYRPLLEVAAVAWLWWFPDRWLRWTVAALCVVHGSIQIWLYGIISFLGFKLAEVSQLPLGKTILFMGQVFGAGFLLGGFYIVAGVGLLMNHALRAYLAYRERDAGYRQPDWTNRPDSFIRDHEQRPQYEVLTGDLLRSLDDHRLIEVIMDHVNLKTAAQSNREHEIISKMSAGMRMVYSTWWVEAEVENGGFHQYFWNTHGEFAFMALEGYRLLRLDGYVTLLLNAIDVFLREEPTQELFRPESVEEMLEKYVEARKYSSLPELDDAFYKLRGYADARTAYVRGHLEEFVTC